MNHFLVRLGKVKHIEYAMPAINAAVTTGYFAVHFGCHDYLRDLFVAQSPSGYREKISSHLRNLIIETQDICAKNGWCNIDTSHSMMDTPKGKIRWFASSTVEPITFGSTYMSSGLLIGLPSFYNYTKPQDIPDQAFEIKKMALLRSAHDQTQHERSKIENEGIAIEGEAPSIFALRKISKESDEGSIYADTLILSDDAKRFSIARQMFYGDTYRPVFKTFALSFSLILACSIGRGFVSAFKLKGRHISYRLAVYSVGGSCGYANNVGIGMGLDQYYAKQADSKAKALGENYVTGAEEYYAKRARRRNILGLK